MGVKMQSMCLVSGVYVIFFVTNLGAKQGRPFVCQWQVFIRLFRSI
jgi:hypothetical protein